ncbi:MAG: low temperature requirement protein A [Acidobacteriota bacterium]
MTSHDYVPDRVSTIELFFDLVFVFTITEVAEVIVHHPDLTGIAHAAIELTVLAWMFGGYAWLTNAAGSITLSCRSILIAGMAAFFVCALSVPHAFDEDGVVFGIGYLLVTIVHLTGLLLGSTPREAVLRLAPFNLISAGMVLAAGFVTGTLDWLLWGGAILVNIATPFLARANRGFELNPTHFAERHGLMILIVLGESLVSVGLAASASEAHVSATLILGALAGLAASAAMWWAYFDGEDEKAARAHERATTRQRADQGLLGFGAAHLIMIFGVIAVAAATKLQLHQLLSPMPRFAASLMAAGCALYLLGGALFRWALGYASPVARIGGAIASGVVILPGLYGSPAAALATIALVIFATLGVERRL